MRRERGETRRKRGDKRKIMEEKESGAASVPMAFFKVMFGDCMDVLNIPPHFAPKVAGMVGKKIILKNSCDKYFEVILQRDCEDGSSFIREGWRPFLLANKIDLKHLLVFELIDGTSFISVREFNINGCERVKMDRRGQQREDFSSAPKAFFKVIVPNSMDSLNIPSGFSTRVEGIVGKSPKTIFLQNSKKKKFKVRIERDRKNGSYFIKKGWSSFLFSNSIDFGYVLIFDLTGDASFSVRVFSTSGCERVDCDEISGMNSKTQIRLLKRNGRKYESTTSSKGEKSERDKTKCNLGLSESNSNDEEASAHDNFTKEQIGVELQHAEIKGKRGSDFRDEEKLESDEEKKQYACVILVDTSSDEEILVKSRGLGFDSPDDDTCKGVQIACKQGTEEIRREGDNVKFESLDKEIYEEIEIANEEEPEVEESNYHIETSEQTIKSIYPYQKDVKRIFGHLFQKYPVCTELKDSDGGMVARSRALVLGDSSILDLSESRSSGEEEYINESSEKEQASIELQGDETEGNCDADYKDEEERESNEGKKQVEVLVLDEDLSDTCKERETEGEKGEEVAYFESIEEDICEEEKGEVEVANFESNEGDEYERGQIACKEKEVEEEEIEFTNVESIGDDKCERGQNAFEGHKEREIEDEETEFENLESIEGPKCERGQVAFEEDEEKEKKEEIEDENFEFMDEVARKRGGDQENEKIDFANFESMKGNELQRYPSAREQENEVATGEIDFEKIGYLDGDKCEGNEIVNGEELEIQKRNLNDQTESSEQLIKSIDPCMKDLEIFFGNEKIERMPFHERSSDELLDGDKCEEREIEEGKEGGIPGFELIEGGVCERDQIACEEKGKEETEDANFESTDEVAKEQENEQETNFESMEAYNCERGRIVCEEDKEKEVEEEETEDTKREFMDELEKMMEIEEEKEEEEERREDDTIFVSMEEDKYESAQIAYAEELAEKNLEMEKSESLDGDHCERARIATQDEGKEEVEFQKFELIDDNARKTSEVTTSQKKEEIRKENEGLKFKSMGVDVDNENSVLMEKAICPVKEKEKENDALKSGNKFKGELHESELENNFSNVSIDSDANEKREIIEGIMQDLLGDTSGDNCQMATIEEIKSESNLLNGCENVSNNEILEEDCFISNMGGPWLVSASSDDKQDGFAGCDAELQPENSDHVTQVMVRTDHIIKVIDTPKPGANQEILSENQDTERPESMSYSNIVEDIAQFDPWANSETSVENQDDVPGNVLVYETNSEISCEDKCEEANLEISYENRYLALQGVDVIKDRDERGLDISAENLDVEPRENLKIRSKNHEEYEILEPMSTVCTNAIKDRGVSEPGTNSVNQGLELEVSKCVDTETDRDEYEAGVKSVISSENQGLDIVMGEEEENFEIPSENRDGDKHESGNVLVYDTNSEIPCEDKYLALQGVNAIKDRDEHGQDVLAENLDVEPRQNLKIPTKNQEEYEVFEPMSTVCMNAIKDGGVCEPETNPVNQHFELEVSKCVDTAKDRDEYEAGVKSVISSENQGLELVLALVSTDIVMGEEEENFEIPSENRDGDKHESGNELISVTNVKILSENQDIEPINPVYMGITKGGEACEPGSNSVIILENQDLKPEGSNKCEPAGKLAISYENLGLEPDTLHSDMSLAKKETFAPGYVDLLVQEYYKLEEKFFLLHQSKKSVESLENEKGKRVISNYDSRSDKLSPNPKRANRNEGPERPMETRSVRRVNRVNFAALLAPKRRGKRQKDAKIQAEKEVLLENLQCETLKDILTSSELSKAVQSSPVEIGAIGQGEALVVASSSNAYQCVVEGEL